MKVKLDIAIISQENPKIGYTIIYNYKLCHITGILNEDITVSDCFTNEEYELDLDYVKSVVEESMNLDVNYIDHDGSEVSKKVNLLKDGLDYRYYINDENYKNVAIEYYNLIKNTFNILHVVNIVPHFKAMIEGLVSSHKLLSKSSKKYNFTLGIL